MTGRFFVDTNIIAYAHISNDQQKHDAAVSLLNGSLAGSRLWISTQMLSEFYSVMSKNKYAHDKIVGFINAILRNMNILPVTSETVETALHIKGKYQFSYWDSLMLSAALESDSDIVYTEDLQHNQVIEGKLTVVNPFVSLPNNVK